MEDNLIKIGFGLDELKREYKNMFPFPLVKDYTDKIQAVIDRLETDYTEECGYKENLSSALESIDGICKVRMLEDEWAYEGTGYRLCNKYDVLSVCAELNNNPTQYRCNHIYVEFYIVDYCDKEYVTKPNIHYAPLLDKALLWLSYDIPDPDVLFYNTAQKALEEHSKGITKSRIKKKIKFVNVAHFVCMIKPQTGEVLKWIHKAYY